MKYLKHYETVKKNILYKRSSKWTLPILKAAANL